MRVFAVGRTIALAFIAAWPAKAQQTFIPMIPWGPPNSGPSLTLGSGVQSALSNPANAAGGVSVLGGSIASGNCLVWGAGASGVQDLGAPCVPQTQTGLVDVRTLPTPMVPGGTDNAPMIAGLLTANGPPAQDGAAFWIYPGTSAFFPPVPNATHTYYYFSQPLDWSRGGTISCGGKGPYQNTILVFAAGVNGIIQDSIYSSPDGGLSDGSDIAGCAIYSLSLGSGSLTSGSNQVTSASIDGYDSFTGSWGVGDGIIAAPVTWSNQGLNPPQPAPAAPVLTTVPYGTYVTAVSGGTLTLNVAANANAAVGNNPGGANSSKLWRLPAALMYSVTTASGSNTMTVTAGPTTPATTAYLQPGDMIWSDAFPLGATVWSVSSTNSYPQTVTIVQTANNGSNPLNATATHSSGSGKLWRIPAGIMRRTAGTTHSNAIYGFPFGLAIECSSGSTNGGGCTSDIDESNTIRQALVGRMVGGNNTGASTSISNLYGANHIADIVESGTVGSVYVGDNPNSQESGSANVSTMGICTSENYSSFIGMYLTATYTTPYCLPTTGTLEYPAAGNGPLIVGPIQGWPSDSSAIQSGELYGPWAFSSYSGLKMTYATNQPTTAGNTQLAGNAPTNVQVGMSITDLTNLTAIPANTTVTSVNLPNGLVNISNAVASPGVSSGDTLQLATSNAPPCLNFRGGYVAQSEWFSDNCTSTTQWMFGVEGYWSNAWVYSTGNGSYPKLIFAGTDYTFYAGDGDGNIIFPGGLLIGDSNGSPGQERMLDAGASYPSGQSWHKLGDWRANSAPGAGESLFWTETAGGGTGWLPAGLIANNSNGNDWSFGEVVRSGSSSNTDMTGRVTLSGGTATYTLAGTYASAPECVTADVTTPTNSNYVVESTTALTFYGTGTDVLKWICMGRN